MSIKLDATGIELRHFNEIFHLIMQDEPAVFGYNVNYSVSKGLAIPFLCLSSAIIGDDNCFVPGTLFNTPYNVQKISELCWCWLKALADDYYGKILPEQDSYLYERGFRIFTQGYKKLLKSPFFMAVQPIYIKTNEY